MENCLVKELKGSINKVLPIFGYATLAEIEGTNVQLNATSQIDLYNSGGGVVKLSGNGYIIKDGESIGKEVYWEHGVIGGIHVDSGKVYIQCTYNNLRTYLSIKGARNSTCIVKYVDLSAAMLACNADNKTINTIEFISMDITGNIEDISGYPFRYLEIDSVNPSTIEGNIENITRGGTTVISKIRLENHPLITGRLEIFLDHVCANAGNGSFPLNISKCPNITYNGQGITNLSVTVTVNNGSWSIS